MQRGTAKMDTNVSFSRLKFHSPNYQFALRLRLGFSPVMDNFIKDGCYLLSPHLPYPHTLSLCLILSKVMAVEMAMMMMMLIRSAVMVVGVNWVTA